MSDSDGPKLQIDSDWKAQAQAEKERLAKEEAERSEKAGAPGASGERGELPPADFRALMGVLASQAIMGLGAYTDPQSGGVVIDLQGARFAIDLLDVLKQKTEGNRTDEETTEIEQLLSELRARFVQIAQLVAQQQAQGGAGGAPGAIPGTPGGDPIRGVEFGKDSSGPKIEMP